MNSRDKMNKRDKRGFNRRDFLFRAALSGLAVFGPRRELFGQASSQPAAYDGPFWIFINAGGGWDPTDLCDPKGSPVLGSTDAVNTYLTSDIRTAGAITYAPHPGLETFFDKHASRLLVIRGIDLSTNGHSEGLRHTWSGKLPDGNASLAALIAATYAPQLPTSFLTAGGYDFTGGKVGATRIGNPELLTNIAYPNRMRGNTMTEANAKTFHAEHARARIEAVRDRRLQRLIAAQRLNNVRTSMNQLYTAGFDQDTLRRVAEFLPDPLAQDRFQSQAQIAIAAYRAGATISMSAGFGGFDTHSDHDANHIPQLVDMMTNVDFLMTEAERQGVADRVVLVVSSEMGRTPRYNSGQGKDHWSITSMMMMGPGIAGGRVVGATTADVAAMAVLPDTLQPVDAKDERGVIITPAQIHQELRTLAGVSDAYQREYPIYPGDKPIKLITV